MAHGKKKHRPRSLGRGTQSQNTNLPQLGTPGMPRGGGGSTVHPPPATISGPNGAGRLGGRSLGEQTREVLLGGQKEPQEATYQERSDSHDPLPTKIAARKINTSWTRKKVNGRLTESVSKKAPPVMIGNQLEKSRNKLKTKTHASTRGENPVTMSKIGEGQKMSPPLNGWQPGPANGNSGNKHSPRK